MTSNLTPERQAIVSTYREDIDNLKVFSVQAASHRSRMGYMGPISNRDYGKIIERLGRMAQQSPQLAGLLPSILPKVNQYGDRKQACVAILEGFREGLSKEFFDVARAASPQPGRYSDTHRDHTLRTKIAALAWAQVVMAGLTDSSDSFGWALTAVAEEDDVFLPTFDR